MRAPRKAAAAAARPAQIDAQRTIVLLGPQRLTPTLAQAVGALGVTGPVATITAGWQDREGEDQELHEHLGQRSVNLKLYERAERVFGRDPQLAAALRQRQERLREMRELYNLRLAHAVDAAKALLQRHGDPALLDPEREAALQALHELDEAYLRRVSDVHAEFEQRVPLSERAAVVAERRAVGAALAGCAALAIAGGHVALLLNRLRLFGIPDLLAEPERNGAPRPVFAWSAGAMAVSERVVLFHDSPPQGPGNAELFDLGLGLCRGVVPLPHAHRRLRLDDAARVAAFARRFAPACCVAMADGAQLSFHSGRWEPGPGIQVLGKDGALAPMEAPCVG